MKRITRVSATVTAGALSLSVMSCTASTAEASVAKTTVTTNASAQSDPILSGRCTPFLGRGNSAKFAAYYNVGGIAGGGAGARWFYKFQWSLDGPKLGNKNNVLIAVQRDPWHVKWYWKSADSVKPGVTTYSPPQPVYVLLGKKKYEILAKFTFDRSGWDPECEVVKPIR